MALAFDRFNEYLTARPDERINVVFHGGEPLAAGKESFWEALRLLESRCGETRDRISFNIQSNLTLVDDETLSLLKQLGINHIGTSYDYASGVRGLGPDRDTKAYNRRFFDGIRRVEAAGMTWGFIYVVTSATVRRPVETFNHLLNLSSRGLFHFSPVLVYRDADDEAKSLAVTPREYAGFLGAILPLWLARRDRLDYVEPFAHLWRYYRYGVLPAGCNDAPSCGLHVYIGPDGELSQCGRAADWNIIDYGRLADRTLAEVLADPLREELDSRRNRLAEGDCRDCPYLEVCGGGCPLDAYDAYDDFDRRSPRCEALRAFLKDWFLPAIRKEGVV